MTDSLHAHVERSAEITLNGPIEKVFPMFDPINESRWAPHWKIERVHPKEGNVEQGMVFKPISEHHEESVWLINELDLERHKIEYISFTAGSGIKRISIACDPIDNETTRAEVSYEITALTAKKSRELAEYTSEHHQQRIQHWEDAINAVLASPGFTGFHS